jgi:hypothetical protein
VSIQQGISVLTLLELAEHGRRIKIHKTHSIENDVHEVILNFEVE